MAVGTVPSDSSLTCEELAKCVQRLFAERPVVVLGTGATIPHGLPSMPGLAGALLTAITDDPEGWDKYAQRLDETRDLGVRPRARGRATATGWNP